MKVQLTIVSALSALASARAADLNVSEPVFGEKLSNGTVLINAKPGHHELSRPHRDDKIRPQRGDDYYTYDNYDNDRDDDYGYRPDYRPHRKHDGSDYTTFLSTVTEEYLTTIYDVYDRVRVATRTYVVTKTVKVRPQHHYKTPSPTPCCKSNDHDDHDDDDDDDEDGDDEGDEDGDDDNDGDYDYSDYAHHRSPYVAQATATVTVFPDWQPAPPPLPSYPGSLMKPEPEPYYSDDPVNRVPDKVRLLGLLKLAPSHHDRTQLLIHQAGNRSFVYDFNDPPEDAYYESDGGNVISAFGTDFPPFYGTRSSLAKFNLDPCGLIVPHIHPRAQEIIYVVDGIVETQFLTESGSVLITNKVHADQVTIFPEAAVHFVLNPLCHSGEVLSIFNTDDPGITLLDSALF
jgi:hypothetical protein